jgi:xanthine dehydrogenase accessory factor
MRRELLAALNEERAGRRAFVLVTDIASGAQRLVRAAEIAGDPLADVLAEHLRLGKSAVVDVDGAAVFLSVQAPPVRLIAIGAVHISQALAPMAKLAGFDMMIIDPRTAFASRERFPDVELIADWPQNVLPSMAPDAYTGMALLTHDPRIDDPGLHAALAGECFYIGALGSRKTHAKRLERLRSAGFTETQLARIHAPIGLDIGAVSPAEIAVSVLGEIIAALRKKPLRSEKAA